MAAWPPNPTKGIKVMTTALPQYGDAPEATVPVEGELEPSAKGLHLNVGGQSFRVRNTSVSWHMMTFGAAQQKVARNKPIHKDNEEGKPCRCPHCEAATQARNEAGVDMMAAMRNLILSIIVPSDRARFLDFMDTAELNPNELEEAVGEVIGKLGSQDNNGPKVGAKP